MISRNHDLPITHHSQPTATPFYSKFERQKVENLRQFVWSVLGCWCCDIPADALGCKQKTCESRKKTRGPLLSMKYWLVNRDPYNGL